MAEKPRTIFEKIWDEHVVASDSGAPAILAIEWSAVATVWPGLRTFRPRSRSPVKACGLVTSWTRCRSLSTQ